MQELSFLYNLDEINTVAAKVLDFAADKRILLFNGEMGAGKTTLIKKICGELGMETSLSSPTYSIVNEYKNSAVSSLVFHMDLYRLKDMGEALSIGIDGYLFSGNYCFIEWPELILPLLQNDAVTVSLEMIDESIRKITIFKD